jgi:hypothetical protein
MTGLPGPPAPTPSKPGRRLPITGNDIILVLLAVNLIGLLGLGVRVYRGDKPTVVTVGITQLAREYMAKLATTNITPQEARVRTQLFLAVAQDAVKGAANRKGIIVVPRECVLAGEYGDMTAEVAKAVAATLERRTANTADRLAAPTLGAASVQP